MADTTRWTLQRCADAAGQRTAQYPTCAAPEIDRLCLGCGADLRGRKAKTTGLPLVFCGKDCRTKAKRRWHDGPDESAALTMKNYAWGDWWDKTPGVWG